MTEKEETSVGSQTPATVECLLSGKGYPKGLAGLGWQSGRVLLPHHFRVALAAAVAGQKEKLFFTTSYNISLLLWKCSKASVPCVEYT